jgi:hypothetical protein
LSHSLSFHLVHSLHLSDTLVAVLERDTLGVREVRLFVAAVRWAEAEAHRQQLQPTPENKRRVLGKALALIRFPLMTIEEFAAGKTLSTFCTIRMQNLYRLLQGLCLFLTISLTRTHTHADVSSFPRCVSSTRAGPV